MFDILMHFLLASGVLMSLLAGGVFFTFSAFVMRSLQASGNAGASVMVCINTTILRSSDTCHPKTALSTQIALRLRFGIRTVLQSESSAEHCDTA